MPNEGNLVSKSLYSSSSLGKVGDVNLLPISSVGNLKLRTPSSPLILQFFCMSLDLVIISCESDKCVKVTIVVSSLIIPVFVLRTTPRVKSFCRHLIRAMSILVMSLQVTFLPMLLLGSSGILGINVFDIVTHCSYLSS